MWLLEYAELDCGINDVAEHLEKCLFKAFPNPSLLPKRIHQHGGEHSLLPSLVTLGHPTTFFIINPVSQTKDF